MSESTISPRAGSLAIVGVGNPLMGDDGVGIAVIRELGKESLPAGVELFDGGTSLLDVLPEVAHCGGLFSWIAAAPGASRERSTARRCSPASGKRRRPALRFMNSTSSTRCNCIGSAAAN